MVSNNKGGGVINFQFHSEEDIQDVHVKENIVWANVISGKAISGWEDIMHLRKYYIKDYNSTDDALYVSINGKGAKIDKNGNILWSIEDRFFNFSQFEKTFVYIKENRCLLALNDSNGELIWQYTLPKEYSWAPSSTSQETRPATIAQIVGVYKDTLWLVVICDDIMLLGLDLQTGRERYHITEPVQYPTTWSEEERKRKRPFGNGTQIDAQSGILFGGFNHYYGEVELEAAEPAYHLYDIQESTELHGLRMNQFGAWEGDNIYFWEGANNNRFGIFSRKEKAVIWSGQIEEAQNTMPAIRQLDFSDGKLYVLDHHFTLHIFEQEF